MALRLVFMGTAKLSCTILQALVDSPEFEVVAVVTQPDRPKGRQLRLQASPVKERVLQLKLPLLQPERARDEQFMQELRQINPALVAVAAYGQILPQALLDLPQFGCLNVHTSLLPKYRGAAPIQWAILNDEPKTGVTIMKMDAGLDTGAILSKAETTIEPQDTSETLHERLAQMGADLLFQTIPKYVAGEIRPCPQPVDGVSYAPRIKKEDGHIDWSQPARAVWNRVRGLLPWPGAFTFLPGKPPLRLLKIWSAEPAKGSGAPGEVLQADRNGIFVACGDGALRILLLQQEGGRRLPVSDFLAGHSLAPGQRLALGCSGGL
jgi:methionyl-tRNA formyltransferase